MDLNKLLEKYNEYWDNEEIDVDLANELVDAVPRLIDEIKRLTK